MAQNTASDKKPTINDVARLANVSKKTVSRVLNKSPLTTEVTRARVEKVIDELGFVPNPQARALALRRNFFIVLFHDNPNAQTVLNFQKGVLDRIKTSDLALVVRPVDRHSPDMLDDIAHFLDQQRPLAALVLPPISEDDRIAELLRAKNVEYARIGSAQLDDLPHSVFSNDREAVKAACSELIRAGHKAIALIKGPAGFRSAAEREQGFREAMAAAGLPVEEHFVVEGTYRLNSGYVAAQKLLAGDNPPTAIFASNDEMAAGALHAARERGINVPEDLSLVGFDDSPTASHLWPPLSTVRWPIMEMGRMAAQKVAQRYLPDGTDTDLDDAQLSSEFISRKSIAPPRHLQ
ncbi:LacI family DNA-binding transcriptional regulator [Sphingorhabdus arenilitoris]|uniref:LacI family DNA-binding transcriptional regulator n=1 Tax=Sphingorhabdus arenilitoris TaxID=1490041 RepID=A0ABV8RE98_9SPHN